MGVSAYKIGSGECNNYPLIEHVASFGKPMIVSTGMNNIESVKKTVKILEDNNMIRQPDMDTIELMEYQEKLFTLGTKTEVDTLLRGGVKPECLYEVFGEFGSGKTQFCLTLAD